MRQTGLSQEHFNLFPVQPLEKLLTVCLHVLYPRLCTNIAENSASVITASICDLEFCYFCIISLAFTPGDFSQMRHQVKNLLLRKERLFMPAA